MTEADALMLALVKGQPTWADLLAQWADRDDPAVISTHAVWSGRELLRRAAGAADLLATLELAPDQAVPALLSSTPAALALVIGGSCSGHPLAPLGPRLTPAELAPCITGLGAGVLLAEPGAAQVAADVASRCGVRVVVVDDVPAAATPLRLDGSRSSVAFVLHTSGTSGQPKAVPYRQDRLGVRCAVNRGLCGLGPGCRYATASPFHHIAGLGNHAVALAAGAAVVVVPRFTVEVWQGLAEVGVTHGLTVPTMLAMLLDADALALPQLRTLQYGAASIHPQLLARTMRALPDAGLVNLFGMTEGSPITCLGPDDHRAAAAGRTDLLLSVGRAAPGVELRLVDIAPGGIGEVWARADHFNRADDDEGWLHTGDLGRLDVDGYLFLAGRMGDRIVRGGENVHPLEVERVLAEHPEVADAAVVGVPDRRWGEVVKAFVVPVDPARPPSSDGLRAFARAQLAGFKVPTAWQLVPELPRNAAGKVLRRKLMTPSSSTTGTDE